MKNVRNEACDIFFQALLNLKTIDDCYTFFSDVCTIKEMQDMGARFETARLLSEGVSYESITKKTGVSAATISRVSRCLNYGDGGYQKAIDSLKENAQEK